MNLHQQIAEAAEPTNPQEVVDALSKALVGKKITAFGPKGSGLWGDHPEVQTYRIKRIVAHLSKDAEDSDWGNIDVYLDGYHAGGVKGKDAKGNHTILGGMIYTDKTFEKHLKELLAGVPAMKYVKSLGYSEQGMQGRNFVNLDIDFKKFPKKLAEAKSKETIDKMLRHRVANQNDKDYGTHEENEAKEYKKLESRVRAFVSFYKKNCKGCSNAELNRKIKTWLNDRGIPGDQHSEARDIIIGMLGDEHQMGGLKEEAKDKKFKIGDKVLWRGGFGADAQKKVTIIGTGTKNGSKVYDLDNDHWAYAEQLSKAN